MISHLLIILVIIWPQPAERTITFYWPKEDAWGNAVADPEIMKHGDPGIESWGWDWVAVSRDVERDYPMGTLLFVEGEGFKVVHDRTAGYIRNTVDLRVPARRMECFKARVWVIFQGGSK